MHDILLLRHAAAMSSSADGTDGGRPLSQLGEHEARKAGRWLAAHDVRPDRVLCSPARRTVMTARAVMDALDHGVEPTLEPSIYEAMPGTLISLLDQHADAGTILLIGHNPGLEQLVGLLTEGSSTESRGMPPAGLAWLRATMPLQPGAARLHAFWSP
jgi:phosphohistidine phosphatase SixA